MANGRICTGYSKPYVAKYSASGSTVTYTEPTVLARGVSVSISPETSDNNVFYADNVAAETEAGTFTGGSATIAVDGLKDDAAEMVHGLPEPSAITVGDSNTVNIMEYGDNANPPYLGFGCLVRYMEDGVASWVPVMLTKVRFDTSALDAATQEENIDWQTQELTAQIFRDDSSNHNWKKIAAGQSTEAAAEAVLKVMLGGTAS